MMKNKILICLCFLACSNLSIGQKANLTVEGEANLEGNVSIGGASSTGDELFIEDFNEDSAVLLEFVGSSRRCIVGINPSSDLIMGTTSDHDMAFITNDENRMLLTPGGNFGIGTPGPNARLHIREDGDGSTTNTTVLVLESSISKKPTLLFSEGGTGANLNMSLSYDGTGSGASNKLNILNSSGVEEFTFTSGGKLGVGETSPTDELTIAGDLAIEPNRLLMFTDGTNIDASILFSTQDVLIDQYKAGSSIYLTTPNDVVVEAGDDILLDGNDDVVFRTAGSTVMFMDQNGDIAIGGGVPSSRLNITDPGTDSVHAIRFENDSDSNDWDMDVGTNTLILYYNSVLKGYFDSNGAYTAASDRRLKRNIKALDQGALEKLSTLEAKTYYFKDDSIRDEKSIGFIAQEVMEVLPSVVQAPEDEEGYYTLDYGQLTVHSIQAIQEQQELISQLKEEIDAKLKLKEQVETNLTLAHKLQTILASQKEEAATLESKK